MMRRDAVLHGAITDLLALEESIDRGLRDQIDSFDADQPEVVLHLKYVSTFVTAHIAQLSALKARHDTLSDRIGTAVRRAGTAVAGIGASAVEFVRNANLPDQLRDDYSAASLAYAGYRVLFTMASALRDTETCRMAAEFLADYARIASLLQDLLPAAVVSQLEADGFPLEEPVRRQSERRMEQIPVHVG